MNKHKFNRATSSVTINGKVHECSFEDDGQITFQTKMVIFKAEGQQAGYDNVAFGPRVVCRCRYCRADFISKPGAFLCGDYDCVRGHWRLRQQQRRRDRRAWVVHCLRTYGKCKTCKATMPGATRRTRRFCSAACRQKAFRNANSQTVKAWKFKPQCNANWKRMKFTSVVC